MNTKFYRAFAELNDEKQPITKRKSRYIKTEWKEVGGYLADDYVLFDIDDKDVNCNLFFDIVNTFNINCHITESVHGIHAIFKKPDEKLAYGNGRESLVGVWADYKCSNNKGYERIITNGNPLSIINDCNEPDELPWLLFPFGRPRYLQSVKHGDGRHNTLLDLSNVYAIYEDNPQKILDMLNWVNKNVFEEPRKSVNVAIKDVMNSIQYMNQQYTDVELCDIINKVDKNKFNKVIPLLVQYNLVKPDFYEELQNENRNNNYENR